MVAGGGALGAGATTHRLRHRARSIRPHALVVVAATVVMLQGLCLGRWSAAAAATTTATAAPLQRQLGWVGRPPASWTRRSPWRLQELSALLDTVGVGVGGSSSRQRGGGGCVSLAAEGPGSKSCRIGNVGVESPYKGKPPAYRHLVFPGNDTAAEAAAFHRDWEEGARFQLTVRVRPSAVAPSASIAATTGDGGNAGAGLLMAEGELVKLPTAGEAAGGENGGDAARRRTVWRTRAWVGDGEGEREATWELIGQGMAAAQSLGAKRLAIDVTSSRLARELLALPPTAPADAMDEDATTTPRLQGLKEKVWAARKKHFPDASLSVIVAESEEEQREAWRVALNARMQALQQGTDAAPAASKASSGQRGRKAAGAVFKAAGTAADGAGGSSSAAGSSSSGTSSGSGGDGGSGKKKPATPAPPPPAAAEGKFLLRFDGGSRGNPGPSGAGVVLYRHGDGRTEAKLKEVQTDALWLGASGTNNEAEYKGLIAGLRMAREMGVQDLCVEGDSQLVVRQMLGEYKVKTDRLKPLHAEAQELARGFDKFEIRHIERAENARADQLANQALDAHQAPK